MQRLPLLRVALISCALLPLACEPARPPERRAPQVAPAPPPPPVVSSAPAPEQPRAPEPKPPLRLVARLKSNLNPSRFFRDAGVITPCPEHAEGCLLRDGGALAPATGFERRVGPESADPPFTFSASGPWPQQAWMAERINVFGSDEVAINVRRWTDAGWDAGTAFELTSGYRYLGAGPWPGGRIITPVVGFRYVARKEDPNDHRGVRRFREKPRMVVISGPRSGAALPLLDEDPNLLPRAFASLPSGHAFLASGRGDDYDLVVHRWSPGDRRPVRDEIPGLETIELVPERFWWADDPTRQILAVAPDDVYVAGYGTGPDGGYDTAIAHFNGHAWDVSFVPTETPFVTFARGSDGVIWVVCSTFHPPAAGELWRKPPGGAFQRVALPPIPVDGVDSDISIVDVWPRRPDEVWLIASHGPRGAKPTAHGLFLLDPPAPAAGPTPAPPAPAR